MSRVRLSFQAQNRAKSILATRHAMTMLPEGTQIVQPEMVRADGRIYIEVIGDRAELLGVATAAVTPHATVEAEDVVGEPAGECLNCSNIADTPQAKCPACGFLEVSPCPSCTQPIPRTAYVSIAPGLFQCPNPNCRAHVTMHYADPLFTQEGDYVQPLIRVNLALARTA